LLLQAANVKVHQTFVRILLAASLTGATGSSFCRDHGPAAAGNDKDRLFSARSVYEASAAQFATGVETGFMLYVWSSRWMEAEQSVSAGAKEGLAAAKAHYNRMKGLERVIVPAVAAGRRGLGSYLAWNFFTSDAEVLVCQARADAGASANTQAAMIRRLAAAVLIYDAWWCKLERADQARAFFSGLLWSWKWLEAENAVTAETADRRRATEAYLARAAKLENLANDLAKHFSLPVHYVHAARYCRLDAELLLADSVDSHKTIRPAFLETGRRRVEAAKAAYQAAQDLGAWGGDIETLYGYSSWWRTAALAIAATKAERAAASEGHLSRMKELEGTVEKASKAGRVSGRDVFAAHYYRADAELLASKTNAQ
jgi:hypothetical protein